MRVNIYFHEDIGLHCGVCHVDCQNPLDRLATNKELEELFKCVMCYRPLEIRNGKTYGKVLE